MSSLTNANSRTICESHKNTTFAILFGGIGLHEAIRLESLCIWKEVLVLHEAIQGHNDSGALVNDKVGPILVGQLNGLGAEPAGRGGGREKANRFCRLSLLVTRTF